MAQWLPLLAFVPLLVAARLRGIERRTIARVTAAAATTAERAVLLEQSGRIGQFVHNRLVRSGVLQPAGNDRYYFSPTAYAAFCARRRKRAAMVVGLLLIATAILFYRGDLSS